MIDPDEATRTALRQDRDDAELSALIARIESENPKAAAAAFASEVDLVLGRPPTPTADTRRAHGSAPRQRRSPSTTFAWYQPLAAQMPPLLDHAETIVAARQIEIGLFAEERLENGGLIPNSTRRELRTLADEGRRAFELLTLSNLRLVFHWAKGVATSVGEDWVQDAFQAGCIGLMRGLQGWDYTKGYQLSTFISWHIRQQIQRWRMNETSMIRVPVHVWSKLDAEMSRDGADSLLDAARLALDITYLEDLSEDEIESLKQTCESDDPLFAVAVDIDRRRQIDELLATLDERAEMVIRLRNGLGDRDEDMTLDAIGAIYGVTRERIRQIEKKAMDALRLHAPEVGLDELI